MSQEGAGVGETVTVTLGVFVGVTVLVGVTVFVGVFVGVTVLGESKRSLKASYVYLPEKDKVLNKRLKKLKTA